MTGRQFPTRSKRFIPADLPTDGAVDHILPLYRRCVVLPASLLRLVKTPKIWFPRPNRLSQVTKPIEAFQLPERFSRVVLMC